MKKRKIPLRKCVGCNEQKNKQELIRIVKNNEGEIFIDKTGKANGRGVYICNSLSCFEKAKKNKEIEKAFKTRIDESIYEELKNELEK